MPGILSTRLQMAGHEWEDWFEREEFIGQISDIRVQNLQVEREVVQKRTFTRWMNLHLEKCNPPLEVHDLFRDIQDGHILMVLLEELSGCKLLHGFKKSSHRIFRLNNIAKVLSFLEERNVKLVSIDAADVADGNSSIILGLIWNIILFFQIKELTGNIRSQFPSCSSLSSIPTSSDSDASFSSTPSDEKQSSTNPMREHSKAIKKLLQWVQRRTRKYGVAVQDFGKSWTSGLAFLAVIKSIDSSLVDMRKALLRSPRENLEDAFRIAHYSLGIPRLLEPEDMTMNVPDEQSIMMYVSQFLEHFPGIEEPEEPIQVIERSVSMGRLNFRETDFDHFRNGAHRGRVRERSYMFQKDCAAPPPKILISSVSEDRGIVSPPFRQTAARSWSTEDFLSDSSHMEDNSSHVVEESKKEVNQDSNNPDSNSPELCQTHSPTDSALPESVIGDSAISSPDSWLESEYNVTPEKFCESRSDSSLCDSGTAWDIYRATPVEITNSDEGLAPSEDRLSDEQQFYIDEGIYSLSSLESTQERLEGHVEKKQENVLKDKETGSENQEINLRELDQNEANTTEEISSTQIDATVLDIVQNDPSIRFSDSDELANDKEVIEEIKQCNNEEQIEIEIKVTDFVGDGQDDQCQPNAQIESIKEKSNSQKVKSHFQKIDSSEVRENDLKDEACEESVESQYKALGPITGITVPLISISIEPDEPELRLSDSDVEEPYANRDLGQTKVSGSKGAETDIDSEVMIPSCFITENIDMIASEETTDMDYGSLEDFDINELPNGTYSVENIEVSVTTQNVFSPKIDFDNSVVDFSSTSHSEEPEFDILKSEHQDELCSTFSVIDMTNTKQTSLDPIAFESNGNAVTLANDSVDARRDKEQFYTDYKRSSLTGKLDDLEPMDLFYPDKEEPMFAEAADMDMQSWPSVLSVSPLQPAPVSEDSSDNQSFVQLDEDLNGMDSKRKSDQMTPESYEASGSQDMFPVKKREEPLSNEEDAIDLSAAQQQSAPTDPVRSYINCSSGQDENQILPVLRHRKGTHFTESTDNQRPITASASKNDSDSFDYWLGDSWEPYVLLLVWLLLYCFWVLPQMDLKTLPSLLLNTKQ